MLVGKCHCGNVTLDIPGTPKSLTSCNCSLCNRIGALWGYYEPEQVSVKCESEPTRTYRQGDETLDLHHCPRCGNTTHYTSTDKALREHNKPKIAVNLRMLTPKEIEGIPIKRFDGADTWKFFQD